MPRPALAVAPAASQTVTLSVPVSMRWAPFDVPRTLLVPPGFAVQVYARVSNPRFMAVTPDGNLLVSLPGAGKVLLIRPPTAGGDAVVSDFLTGLRRPHDLVFHVIAGTTYLYVAETHQIDRYVYRAGDLTGQGRQVVVTGLPDGSLPELNGSYGHELKNIAIDANGKLYVSIASSCNACTSDGQATPVRAAIYQYDASGGSARLFARGLRNAEGLALVPGTTTLWAVVNNRDNIAYPHNDGSGNYGRVLQWYVDNHPPEEFTLVRDGGNYGWPYCNPSPDSPSGMNDMPFDADYELNRGGSVASCAAMDRISKGIQAHSAPLGLLFLQNTALPSEFRQGVAVAYHGSWNRSTRTGYRIAYFPWDATTQRPGVEQDLVSGWLVNGAAWGRPVDMAADAQGALYISDDQGAAIYKMTFTGAAPPPPPPPPPAQYVASFTLIDADRDVPIAAFDPFRDGTTLNLATLPTRRLNVRANTSPSQVGSVRFGYDAVAVTGTQGSQPYSFADDEAGDYKPWTPTLGGHTIRATPYSGRAGTGTVGGSLAVRFTVVDQPTAPSPAPFAPVTLEAENAVRVGGLVSTRQPGYTGTGYVDYENPSGDYVEWSVSVPAAGTYTLAFRYALLTGDRPLSIGVNGQVVREALSFPATGALTSWRTVSIAVSLLAGANAVRATATGSSGPNMDHLYVTQP